MSSGHNEFESIELSNDALADADVLVEMGEWAQVHGEQVIGTQGLGPCIGLAIYDPTLHIGYMAHTLGSELGTIDTLLDHVSGQGCSVSDFKAWLGGAELDTDEETSAYITDIREGAIWRVQAAGIVADQVEVTWLENSDEMMSMVLDCATGELSFYVENTDYLDDDLTDDEYKD